MITVSAVASTLFLGGWSLFGFGLERIPGVSILIFLVKVAFFLFVFIWLRATLPRIRYDRLMRLGWQVLLPLAVLNVVITAIIVAFGLPWWVNGIIGLAILLAVLFGLRRQSIVEGQRFAEQPEKGVLVLPSSVRLAKFERASIPTPTTETKAEQDVTAAKA
jgi:NADH-quinone oxidoreductase subunit H